MATKKRGGVKGPSKSPVGGRKGKKGAVKGTSKSVVGPPRGGKQAAKKK